MKKSIKVLSILFAITIVSINTALFAKDYRSSELIHTTAQAQKICTETCKKHGGWNGNWKADTNFLGSPISLCGCKK